MAYAPLGQGNRSEMFDEPFVLNLAKKYSKTPAQIMLRFITQKNIAVIPRSTSPQHIHENFALFDFTLNGDEMSQLSALDKKEPALAQCHYIKMTLSFHRFFDSFSFPISN